MSEHDQSAIDVIPASLEETLLSCGREPAAHKRVKLVSSPTSA